MPCSANCAHDSSRKPTIAANSSISSCCASSGYAISNCPSQCPIYAPRPCWSPRALDSAPLETGDPALGAAVVEAINRQVFELGALHADPHPGNFGITERGAMALYDFGCLKYLDQPTRAAMRDILAAAMAEDWAGVHAGMERLGAVPEGSWERHSDVYRDIYARHAESALAPLRERRPYVFERDELIDSIRAEIGRSMGYWRYFRAAPDMVFVMRTLSGLYWILRSLHAEVDLYAELERIVAGEYGPPEAIDKSR